MYRIIIHACRYARCGYISDCLCVLAEYCIYFTARFGGVHAFGYDSADSEPILIKSGALWVWEHCRGLALADVGRDPHNSDSGRDRRNL